MSPAMQRASAVLAIGLWISVEVHAQAPTPAIFTYQGQLTDNGLPADGTFDFQFKLFDGTGVSATQIGVTDCEDAVSVTDGLFTVRVDFGSSGLQRRCPLDGNRAPARCDRGQLRRRRLHAAVAAAGGLPGSLRDHRARNRGHRRPLAGRLGRQPDRCPVRGQRRAGRHRNDRPNQPPAHQRHRDRRRSSSCPPTPPRRSLQIENTDQTGQAYDIGVTGSAAGVGPDKLVIRDVTAGNTARMTLDSAGNLGIGTTSPQERLHVDGNIQVANNGDISGLDDLVGFNDLRLAGDAAGGADFTIFTDGQCGVGSVYTNVALNVTGLDTGTTLLNVELADGTDVFEVQADQEVFIVGDFFVQNGTKNFILDHPLDPANRSLAHNAVEGPGYYTFYRGNAVLDDTGAGLGRAARLLRRPEHRADLPAHLHRRPRPGLRRRRSPRPPLPHRRRPGRPESLLARDGPPQRPIRPRQPVSGRNRENRPATRPLSLSRGLRRGRRYGHRRRGRRCGTDGRALRRLSTTSRLVREACRCALPSLTAQAANG